MPFKNPNKERITLALFNAKVWTANLVQPWAQALAVSGETLVAIGSNEVIRSLMDKTTHLIDAQGRMVTPGFIDTHVHLLMGGFRLTSVQLRDARTPQEFIARIQEFAQTMEPGTWVTGGDWNQQNWGGELPSRDWIDAVTPEYPVWVNRIDGHMGLANGKALRMAGITRDSPDIEGGVILRTSSREPTGLLKDRAMSLVDRVVPQPSDALKDRALEVAMNYLAERGVTSVHHMSGWDKSAWNDLAVFERAHRTGKLRTRIYATVHLSNWERLRDKMAAEGQGDGWLRIGGLKGFADGSLGSHTAAFLEPYTDAPDDRGLLLHSPKELYQWISAADQSGLQVMVHAIGDHANRLMLDLYEQVNRENGPRDRRLRIEHAQHIHPDDIPRFAALGVIASMQPYHAIDDGRWAEELIGSERIKTTHAFRSLLNSQARLAFGSDWFVAPPTPLEGICAAVTRRTLNGKHPEGWVPEQKISVEEALRAYTLGGAYAAFEEDLKGSLEPGKLADFVIIDKNLTEIPPEAIRECRILMTVVGGQIVHRRRCHE